MLLFTIIGGKDTISNINYYYYYYDSSLETVCPNNRAQFNEREGCAKYALIKLPLYNQGIQYFRASKNCQVAVLACGIVSTIGPSMVPIEGYTLV